MTAPVVTTAARGRRCSSAVHPTTGAIYAKDASRPVVFTVEQALATDLGKDMAEFRRKDVFDARSFSANRLELRRGSETMTFEKSEARRQDHVAERRRPECRHGQGRGRADEAVESAGGFVPADGASLPEDAGRRS